MTRDRGRGRVRIVLAGRRNWTTVARDADDADDADDDEGGEVNL